MRAEGTDEIEREGDKRRATELPFRISKQFALEIYRNYEGECERNYKGCGEKSLTMMTCRQDPNCNQPDIGLLMCVGSHRMQKGMHEMR